MNFSTKEGLSQNTVYCFTQDNSGFIWIGTNHGLNRYDGHNFVKYFHDPQDSLSLSNNTITALENSKDGGIWVGTDGAV